MPKTSHCPLWVETTVTMQLAYLPQLRILATATLQILDMKLFVRVKELILREKHKSM